MMGEVETVDAPTIAPDFVALGENEETSVANVGVSARASSNLRPAWQKGQSGNPFGRPASAKLYKAELMKRFPPEKLAEYWLEALAMARQKKDGAAAGRILKDISEQLMGKAVATNVTVKTKYEELLMLRLAAGEGEEIDGEAIETQEYQTR